MFKYCDALRKVGNSISTNKKMKVASTICCRPVILFLTDKKPQYKKVLFFIFRFFNRFCKLFVKFDQSGKIFNARHRQQLKSRRNMLNPVLQSLHIGFMN